MKDFMEQKFLIPKEGTTVSGTVVSVRGDLLLIDLGSFTEGELSLREYTQDKHITTFKGLINVNDTIECVVTKVNKNGDDTSIELSRLPLIRKENEKIVEASLSEGSAVSVKVEKKVNKGFIAKYLGVEVFIPESQIDMNVNSDTDYANQTIEVKIIDVKADKNPKTFVGSRRVLLENELNENKTKEYDLLKVGEDVEGTIYKIESFGALIKFNYNVGLLRISNIAHTRTNNINDVFKLGEKVTVRIIKKENGKLDLSRKALLKTPHEIYAETHKVSDVVNAKVIQKLPIGIIVELETHITALLHKNEFSWNPNDNSMDYVKLGDTIEAAIINLDVKNEKIGLSKKVLIDNPWSRVDAKVGDLTTAKITEILSGSGVNVAAYGVDGFIPKSELVLAENKAKIEDNYLVGDEVTAVVTEVNPRYWKLKLSVKQHTDQVEREQFEEYMESQQDVEEKVSLGDMFKDILK